MRIAALVLAAGEGRRIGGPKALLPIGDTTFLARVCELFAGAGVDPIVAVLGAQAERVRARAALPEGVRVVVNELWSTGMLSSIGRGLDAAEALGADAVLVHPVDHPLVGVETIRRVEQALLAGAAIAVPTWQGRRGHPGGFARTVFEELRSASPELGARSVVGALPDRVVHVPGDAGCRTGFDLPEQLAGLGVLPTRVPRG